MKSFMSSKKSKKGSIAFQSCNTLRPKNKTKESDDNFSPIYKFLVSFVFV